MTLTPEQVRSLEVKRDELMLEIDRLRNRYDRGLENAQKFSELSVEQFFRDSSTKAILDRIQMLEEEAYQIEKDLPKLRVSRRIESIQITSEMEAEFRKLLPSLSDEEFQSYIEEVNKTPEKLVRYCLSKYNSQDEMTMLCCSFDFSGSKRGWKYWNEVVAAL